MMSKVLFISDLHLRHANCLKWAGQYREGNTIEEHDDILIEKLKSSVNKRDVLYILGDVVFGDGDITTLLRLNEVDCAQKILVRGNHDNRFTTRELLTVFDEIEGLKKYKQSWLSHAPISHWELRGKFNIHGHVHHNSIRDHYHQLDHRYVNVCVEALNGWPISFQDILNGKYWERKVV